MSAPIVATKVSFPPPRRNLILRPRLTERLAAGLQGPLTLFSAPPGSGKTTLMSEWRAGPGRDAAVAWLSLDEGDNDPVLFLQYLLAALGTVQQGLAEDTAGLLQAGAPAPPEMILTSLLNELSAGCSGFPGGVVLVLDDYHLITTPAIHDALAFLLLHLPPSLHLVILGREDPPLPLSRLRVRGELTEIREGDLRFTVEETAAFLSQTMGLNLSEQGIASLAERTEGWIAALQIAGLSLKNRVGAEEFIAKFRGDDRYVMDYLMDEVLRRQPPQIQDFLLQTSILERLCASLCDEVISPTIPSLPGEGPGVGSSQASLEHLERANLFVVALDNRREWYRYHNLFADLLRYRLQRTDPQRLPELHRRACLWYARAGDPDEAMRHARAIPDANLAADLAESYMLFMTGSSRMVTYLGWVRDIPQEVILGRAYLCAGCGWAYALINQADAAQRFVDAGEAALPAYRPVYSTPEGRYITRMEVAGNLAAIHSYVDRLRNDLHSAIAHAQEALNVLPSEALAVRCAAALNLGLLHLEGGALELAREAFYQAFEAAKQSRTNIYVAITALSQLGGIAAMQGKLRVAEGLFRRALRFGEDEVGPTAPIPSAGIVHGWLLWVHYQRNELGEAQEHLDLLLQSAVQMGIPETTARTYLYQALLAQTRGEVGLAEESYGRAEELMRSHSIGGLIQTEWIAFRGQGYLWLGDLAAAARLLEKQGVQAGDLDGRLSRDSEEFRVLATRLAQYVLLARVLAAQGAGPRADALLERICTIAEAVPNIEVLLQALALRAVIAGSPRGLAHLQRALDLAAPESFARPFLDAGGALVGPLRQAIMQGIQPAFAQRLLASLAVDERRRATVGQLPDALKAPTAATLIEPLTERERQVLRLLAAGLSSTEVAEELVISVSTARSYIKSLYGKLGAHSRDEAIEQGSQAGLL